MKKITWTPKSIRNFKSLVRRNQQLRPLIEEILRRLAEDPFHPSLRTHKLQGDLSNVWSCSIDYSYRILFKFVKNSDNEDAILLIKIGDHDEVY
ncbi:type II toxin-antitoxin system mRNA interferase toxin, RelE/StbE family [Argonema galeatum]|uniref:type II toxin-antitoxin system RelE/ParE family toxin n=1 Tax=Argonema galeatum TaxID=2942762 RepID=UPI002011B7F3|nr:type II toxin-antitoxin system mRNA interferase toxin, RelE/StbE family [Argonema galeatum A003/A1]